jgi:hypothetical protein
MKTIKLTTNEQVMLLSSLKVANLFQRPHLREKGVKDQVKSRIRLFRKVVQLSDLRGDKF